MNGQTNIVELMIKIEELMENHYRDCARRFPEKKDFWLDIAKQESDHQKWLKELNGKVIDAEIALDERRFDKESIKELHKHLKSMVDDMAKRTSSMKEVLATSAQIESIVLEKDFFEIFISDSKEVKDKIEHIKEDTRNHRKKLQDYLDSLGN